MDHTNGSDSRVSCWLGPVYAVESTSWWTGGCDLLRTRCLQNLMWSHQYQQQPSLWKPAWLMALCFYQVLLSTSPVTSSSTALAPSQKQPWWDFLASLKSTLECDQQLNVCLYHPAYGPGFCLLKGSVMGSGGFIDAILMPQFRLGWQF